jgi:quinol monooxygenase YgiN
VESAARASSPGFGLIVRFALRPGRETEFDQLVSATVDEIRRREPGTLLYVTHTVRDEPQVRIFYELYRDEAAFDAHEREPHIRDFLAERERLIERVDVDWVRPGATAMTLGIDT